MKKPLFAHLQGIDTNLSIAEAQAAFKSGELTSVQLVGACLSRAEAGKDLNTFITLDVDSALAAAQSADEARIAGQPQGALAGIPIAIKDNIHVQGLPSTAGTPALADYYPDEDAAVVARLREAGAIIIGKAHMHELAFGATGYNTAFNHGNLLGIRNPYNPEHIAGGSSSGSAAALGARMALAALGTDTGGSMRIPCALNGCSSLRPSAGRYSQKGVTPISSTRDTTGPMALCMADVALLDTIITGEASLPPVCLSDLRLGVIPSFWANLDDDTQAAAETALGYLRGAGVKILVIEDERIHALNQAIGFPIVLHEAYDDMVSYLNEYHPDLRIEQLAEQIECPDVRMIYEQFVLPRRLPGADGSPIASEPVYRHAMDELRPQLMEHYAKLFEEHHLDALVFPTVPTVAPLATPEVSQPQNFAHLIQNTEAAASAGLPSIQLPIALGRHSGLPIGLELDGKSGGDRELLAIGIALEAVLGRIPPASDR